MRRVRPPGPWQGSGRRPPDLARCFKACDYPACIALMSYVRGDNFEHHRIPCAGCDFHSLFSAAGQPVLRIGNVVAFEVLDSLRFGYQSALRRLVPQRQIRQGQRISSLPRLPLTAEAGRPDSRPNPSYSALRAGKDRNTCGHHSRTPFLLFLPAPHN